MLKTEGKKQAPARHSSSGTVKQARAPWAFIMGEHLPFCAEMGVLLAGTHVVFFEGKPEGNGPQIKTRLHHCPYH